jgi:pyridoxal phosphate enzyme (YggS family)
VAAGAGTGASDVADRVARVRRRIAEACRRAGRDPSSVTLVGATKSVPVARIRAAWDAGVLDFGENYAVELAEKAPQVPATWHFFGKLQRGTAAAVARHADVVHSAEPGEALARVAARAVREGKILRTLIQVDFTGRRQGVAPDDLPPFVEEVLRLPGLRLCGLMTLPPPAPDPEAARPFFAQLRAMVEGLRADAPDLVELSMGMSLDYEVAVGEGATMVRVGTALFGPRPPGRRGKRTEPV